jgi:hypothetical protein
MNIKWIWNLAKAFENLANHEIHEPHENRKPNPAFRVFRGSNPFQF